jgi:hypothetical protein
VRGIIRPDSSGSAQTFIVWGAQLEQASTVGDYVPTAATINSAPRFDHNPTTGESLGLLVEEARTNLLQRSEEFDNGYWNPIEVIRTPNAAASPSGLTTADLITESASSSYHEIFVTSGATAGTYTFSVFVKNNLGTRHLNICFSSGTTQALSLRVNAATGSLSSIYTEGSVFSAATSTVISYPNGWYKVSISFAVNTGFANQLALSTSSAAPPAANFGLESYAGDGTSGIYIWGAQLEAGAFPTSYIPTTSATVTRAADVASVTGSNFSSFYNQTEGTVFVNGVIPFTGSTNFPAFASVDDGNVNDAIEFAMWDAASDVVRYVIYDNGTAQASLGGETYTAGSVYSLAGAYALNNFAASYRGGSPSTDSAGTLPTVDRLRIGQNRGSGNSLNGTIKRLTYWPTRLANTVLQQITQP